MEDDMESMDAVERLKAAGTILVLWAVAIFVDIVAYCAGVPSDYMTWSIFGTLNVFVLAASLYIAWRMSFFRGPRENRKLRPPAYKVGA